MRKTVAIDYTFLSPNNRAFLSCLLAAPFAFVGFVQHGREY
jgi:hypothetical protein